MHKVVRWLVVTAVVLVLLIGPTLQGVAAQGTDEGTCIPIPKIPGLYVCYDKATPPNPNKLIAFGTIGPGFYTNKTLDALMVAAKYETDPVLRTKMYNVIQAISNYEVPLIWIGQAKARAHRWNWLHVPYFNPVLAAQYYPTLWKDPKAPNPDKLIILDIGDPESLDPAQTYETSGWGIDEQIYDRIVWYWGNDSYHVVPMVAYAWALSPDGKTLYLAVRDGIKFYDPWDKTTYSLTPEDVAYSINRIIESANYAKVDYPEWILADFIDKAVTVNKSEVEAALSKGAYAPVLGSTYFITSLDQWYNLFKTKFSYVPWQSNCTKIAGYVKVELKRPYLAILPCLATNLGDVVSKTFVEKHATQDDPLALKYLHEHPCGSGPYYLVEWKHQDHITLKANPYYWGSPKPKLTEVDIKIVPEEETRIMALAKGQADTGAVAAISEYKLEGKEYIYNGVTWKFEMPWLGPTFDIVHVYLNCRKDPFDKTLVRQALAWAVDYDFIINAIYRGHLMPVTGVIPKGMPGWTDKVPFHYHLDLAKAKDLLARAGVDPSKYTITIYYNQGNKNREMMATVLQNTWSKLGFHVKAQALTWPTYLKKIGTGDFQVAILGWAPDYNDPDDYAYPLMWGGCRFEGIKAVYKSGINYFVTSEKYSVVAVTGVDQEIVSKYLPGKPVVTGPQEVNMFVGGPMANPFTKKAFSGMGIEFGRGFMKVNETVYESVWGKEDYGVVMLKNGNLYVAGTNRFGTEAALLYATQMTLSAKLVIVKWVDKNGDGAVEFEEITAVKSVL